MEGSVEGVLLLHMALSDGPVTGSFELAKPILVLGFPVNKMEGLRITNWANNTLAAQAGLWKNSHFTSRLSFTLKKKNQKMLSLKPPLDAETHPL